MKYNIALVMNNPSFSKDEIEKFKKLWNIQIFNVKKLLEEEAIKLLQNIDILVCWMSWFEYIWKELIDWLPKMKFISVYWVWYDFINVKYAKDKWIIISTATWSNSESVAEHTWGMILNLSKRISEFERETRKKWEIDVWKFQWIEVYWKTIWILWLGNIWKKISRISRWFDMKILWFSKSTKNIDNIKSVSKNELISQSDIIVLALPLNKDTENIIDYDDIKLMKDNIIIVNCAREKLVNKKAVLDWIKNWKIFGYWVETEIYEEIKTNDEYFMYPNVLLTPHNAWNTTESDKNKLLITLENIKAFINWNPINTI